MEVPDAGPLARDRPYRAGDELDLDAHSIELRQYYAELPIANERFTPYYRDMNRFIKPDEFENPIHKRLALVIGQRSQRTEFPKVSLLVSVATWAA
jgi:hypothetical protein